MAITPASQGAANVAEVMNELNAAERATIVMGVDLAVGGGAVWPVAGITFGLLRVSSVPDHDRPSIELEWSSVDGNDGATILAGGGTPKLRGSDGRTYKIAVPAVHVNAPATATLLLSLQP